MANSFNSFVHVAIGGFKLWECALDLVEYLAQSSVTKLLPGASVAEVRTFLFCGYLDTIVHSISNKG